jgi:carbon-monoxide dehydrogenase large subunit
VAGFAARKAASEAKGLKRGIGYSSYIEACGIAPSNIAGALGARAGLFECGEVRVHPTGSVTVFTGSHSHGQGHETTFAQVVAARLGIPVENVDIVHGDTGRVPFGMGTYGSRSISVGGAAIMKALDKIEAKAKKIAAHLMEASDADIDFANGEFTVRAPTRRSPSARWRSRPMCRTTTRWTSSSRAERNRVLRPDQLHLPRRHLHLRGGNRPGHRRDPRGQVHGGGRLRHHHQPHDRGGPGARRPGAGHWPGAAGKLRVRPRNRPVAHRQLHGLRHAARRRLPQFKLGHVCTPCTHNPLGTKGCGEAGPLARHRR